MACWMVRHGMAYVTMIMACLHWLRHYYYYYYYYYYDYDYYYYDYYVWCSGQHRVGALRLLAESGVLSPETHLILVEVFPVETDEHIKR